MNSTVLAVKNVREILKRSDGPISIDELIKKTGVRKDDIINLENNYVVIPWFSATMKAMPVDFKNGYGNAFGSEATEAKKIAEYLAMNPGRQISKYEFVDVLKLEEKTVFYVLGFFHLYGLVDRAYTLAPDGNCKICFFRERCDKTVPAVRCNLFQNDYRLAVKEVL